MAETAEEAVRQCETRGNEFSLGWHSVRHLPVLSCFLSCFLRGEIVRLAPRARIHVGVDAKTGRLRGRIPCFQRVWRSLHRIQVRMRPAGRPVKRKRAAHHSQPSSSTNTSHVEEPSRLKENNCVTNRGLQIFESLKQWSHTDIVPA